MTASERTHLVNHEKRALLTALSVASVRDDAVGLNLMRRGVV